MKNAILVPGMPYKDEHYDPRLPSNSEAHWFSWLKRQLILKDIHAIAIEPPFPYKPRYEDWEKEFERFDITPETILVGWSCGGGFLVRYICENKDIKVGKVVLVAPWINPYKDKSYDTADFFNFNIDANFPKRTKSVTIFISNDDESDVLKTVEILKREVSGLVFKEYKDKGHFTSNDIGTTEFPEILEVILAD